MTPLQAFVLQAMSAVTTLVVVGFICWISYRFGRYCEKHGIGF